MCGVDEIADIGLRCVYTMGACAAWGGFGGGFGEWISRARLLLLYVLVLKVYERTRAGWTMDGVSVIVGS